MKLNKITTIRGTDGVWFFSDAERGIIDEPFVGSVNGILDKMSGQANGAILWFSEEKETLLPWIMTKLQSIEQSDGVWSEYEIGVLRGWLCPRLLAYFDSPPKHIHFKITPLSEDQVELAKSKLRQMLIAAINARIEAFDYSDLQYLAFQIDHMSDDAIHSFIPTELVDPEVEDDESQEPEEIEWW